MDVGLATAVGSMGKVDSYLPGDVTLVMANLSGDPVALVLRVAQQFQQAERPGVDGKAAVNSKQDAEIPGPHTIPTRLSGLSDRSDRPPLCQLGFHLPHRTVWVQ